MSPVDRATADRPQAQSRDLARSLVGRCLWYVPMAMAVVGFLIASARWPIWTAVFLWAGAACLANAARCGRVHCAFTGPLYIALGLLCGSNAMGWSSVGWLWVWGAAIAGTLASFIPEWLGRRYWKPAG